MIYRTPFVFVFILRFCFNFLRVLQEEVMKECLYFILEVSYITGKLKDKIMEHWKLYLFFFS